MEPSSARPPPPCSSLPGGQPGTSSGVKVIPQPRWLALPPPQELCSRMSPGEGIIMHSAFSSPSSGWFLPFSTRHTLVSCFKKRKETSLTPPPGQSYLLLPLQGHFQGVVCSACGRVLTSHSLLLGLLFGFQLHQSGETSGRNSAALSRPLLSRATSCSLPRAAASPGPRPGRPGSPPSEI